jgi:hypothetical protein
MRLGVWTVQSNPTSFIPLFTSHHHRSDARITLGRGGLGR